MERTWSTKKESDGEVFISRQNCHFSVIDNMNKVLFPFCTLNWRVYTYVSRQGKGINGRNESTTKVLYKIVAFPYCAQFDIIKCLLLL